MSKVGWHPGPARRTFARMSTPTCARCGSTSVQRARMRTWWQRLLKARTRLRRYACDDCYHRGWTTRSFARPAGVPAGADGESTGSRPLPGPAYRRGLTARSAVTMALTILSAGLLGGLIP